MTNAEKKAHADAKKAAALAAKNGEQKAPEGIIDNIDDLLTDDTLSKDDKAHIKDAHTGEFRKA